MNELELAGYLLTAGAGIGAGYIIAKHYFNRQKITSLFLKKMDASEYRKRYSPLIIVGIDNKRDETPFLRELGDTFYITPEVARKKEEERLLNEFSLDKRNLLDRIFCKQAQLRSRKDSIRYNFDSNEISKSSMHLSEKEISNKVEKGK